MNIEFGCGANPKEDGYKTCDIRNLPGIDYVCSAIDIADYCEHNSVNNIFSRHMFEHLTFHDGELYLDACMKILVSGGVLRMMMPNMTFHINQWLSKDPAVMDHARAGFWGWQREVAEGEDWDIHKSGYDFGTLNELLLRKGFVNIQRNKSLKHKHLSITALKP
jgi:predicted SAM-dependent methyltransferase|tara:strand:+ start:1521 stop:2012 length:492 start_codon:yes stop_codon:yes gene_type:complete